MTKFQSVVKHYHRLTTAAANTDGLLLLASTIVIEAKEDLKVAYRNLRRLKILKAPADEILAAEKSYQRAKGFFYTPLFQIMSGYSGDEFVRMEEAGFKSAEDIFASDE